MSSEMIYSHLYAHSMCLRGGIVVLRSFSLHTRRQVIHAVRRKWRTHHHARDPRASSPLHPVPLDRRCSSAAPLLPFRLVYANSLCYSLPPSTFIPLSLCTRRGFLLLAAPRPTSLLRENGHRVPSPLLAEQQTARRRNRRGAPFGRACHVTQRISRALRFSAL